MDKEEELIKILGKLRGGRLEEVADKLLAFFREPEWWEEEFDAKFVARGSIRAFEEGVSDVLIACQTDTPNSYRWIHSPITQSCLRSVVAKQIGRRTNRLIRVRQLRCWLSICCVCAFPTVCCSVSTCRS
jgi:hypothetical protein